MKSIWSGPARRDVDDIWYFIARDNLDAADAVAERLRGASVMLEEFPRLGRSGRLPGTREFAVSGTPYLLIYRAASRRLEILRVIHGARDWPPKRKRP
jgi:plasmid stabilization system protein ParE